MVNVSLEIYTNGILRTATAKNVITEDNHTTEPSRYLTRIYKWNCFLYYEYCLLPADARRKVV